jgi:hypothetical protein
MVSGMVGAPLDPSQVKATSSASQNFGSDAWKSSRWKTGWALSGPGRSVDIDNLPYMLIAAKVTGNHKIAISAFEMRADLRGMLWPSMIGEIRSLVISASSCEDKLRL